MPNLNAEYLFTLHAELEPPQLIGPAPLGMRMIFPVKSGTIDGPRGKGTVLPGGGDWFLQRSDGVGVLDVRATAQMDDGSLVYAWYRGILNIDPATLERVQAGEAVDPAEYYFRTTPVFETVSETYADLNSLVTVGVGRLGTSSVTYDIFAIR